MTSKRERQRGKYGYSDGAVGDVDSVRDGRFGMVVTLLGHDLEYEVTTIETDGGPEITHLWIKGEPGRPITTEDLRRIPVRRLASAAARWVDNFNAIGDRDPNQWSQPERAQTKRPRRVGDEHYQQVAGLAQQAFKDGLKVRDTVGRELNASVYTVDKWLRECRDRGLLKRGELQRRKSLSDKGRRA